MAKDDWILSSEHPEEKIINMIKAKSNLNLNMHEPVNNISDTTLRYGMNRTRKTFGDRNVTVITPTVEREDFISPLKNSIINRRESFTSPSKSDGLSFRRETLEMKHHKRMFLNNSDVPIKTVRDRSNNSSPSSLDFDDNRYTRNELLQQKRRTVKSKSTIHDDSVSEMSDARKKSIDESDVGTLSRASRHTKYLPVKYPDDVTHQVERNRKVKRSNSHYVTSPSSKHQMPQERRRSDDLMASTMSLPYRQENKKEKKLSPLDKVKQFFNPKTKRKKVGEIDIEKESVMSARSKPGAGTKSTKLKRTASSSDSENVYRRPESKSTKHMNGKAGWSSYGESEEEPIRRNGKYKDEVDDSSANESGIRHWKNDVYLHSSAVGDIPVNQSTLQRSEMRRAKSREELSSSKASLISPARKTLSRSISVLSPWTPRLKKYKNEINYNDSGAKPPRSPSKKSSGHIDSNGENKSKKINGDVKGKKYDSNKTARYTSGTLPNPKTYSDKSTLRERNQASPDRFSNSTNKLKFVGKSGGNMSSKTYLRKSQESLNSQDYILGHQKKGSRKTFNSESSMESSLPDEEQSVKGGKNSNHKVYTIPIKHQSGILRSTTIPRNTRLPSRT